MSKLYKATIYIDDISGKFNNIEDIKQELDNYTEDISFTFEKVEEQDITDYIDKVGDDYPWNTDDEHERIVVLHNFFEGNEEE